MPLVIENGAGSGVYDKTNLAAVLDAVASVINRKFAGKSVKKGPLPLLHSADYYRFATLDSLALFMLEVDQYGNVCYLNMQPPANLPLPRLEYGADHGNYHFGGDPTAQKSKWTLPKAAALQLMEAEISKHFVRMRSESRTNGWEGWYVGGQAPGNIGMYAVDGKRGGAPTTMFTIQAQVNWFENVISYHGFPDERLMRVGLGKERNSIV